MSECSGCRIAVKYIEKLEDEIRTLKMPMTFTFMGYSESELTKILDEYNALTVSRFPK